MLFNSYQFILIYLPLVFAVFAILSSSKKTELSLLWLVLASLFFYGWWNYKYVALIVISIAFNFLMGRKIIHLTSRASKTLLIFGITFNLLLLGYYKYANFFIQNINWLSNSNFHLETIVLPLAISFFTFQQIAFLVDSYKKEVPNCTFLQYCLFVCFFPQLIAGPIVHHKEMLPQFYKAHNERISASNISIGLTIFFIGLFKKVVLADGIAPYANTVFNAADLGENVSTIDAWIGALCYTFQLYFDFSGYSDMAIGIARIFGIRLPMNFFSPYQAFSIIDFWRRWHITLSRFLKDYLYIALGGNRKGEFRRYVNLSLTMLIGGLWHGAGWNFVIWGGLHGIYLIINHLWRSLGLFQKEKPHVLYKYLSGALTFLSVVIAWVFFRATSTDGAIELVTKMLDLEALWNGNNAGVSTLGHRMPHALAWVLLLSVVAFTMPNSLQMTRSYNPSYEVVEKGLFEFRLSKPIAISIGVLTFFSLMGLSGVTEFLYFQF